MVLRLYAVVPDLTVCVSSILDKLPMGDEEGSATSFGGALMWQAAMVIDISNRRSDITAECLAGVQESHNVYAVLVKVDPKDREEHLDNFIQLGDAETFMQFVKERAVVACKNLSSRRFD